MNNLSRCEHCDDWYHEGEIHLCQSPPDAMTCLAAAWDVACFFWPVWLLIGLALGLSLCLPG